MDTSGVVVSDNSLKMKVCFSIQPGRDLISQSYKVCFIEFQLKAFIKMNRLNIWSLFIKFNKCVDDELLYTLKVNSTELNLTSKTFISDDSDWREVGCYSTKNNVFNIELNVGMVTYPYSRFVDDDSLTDFEIKGTDGSIRVHKIVLAAASEVFEKIITNDFKEKNEAQVELPYSKDVLKDFKDYLYMNTLNSDNLEHLLMLSHCYMINKLKQYCMNKLLFKITTKKSLELIEFAVENKITELLIAILKKIENQEVDFTNYEIILPGQVESQMKEGMQQAVVYCSRTTVACSRSAGRPPPHYGYGGRLAHDLRVLQLAAPAPPRRPTLSVTALDTHRHAVMSFADTARYLSLFNKPHS